MTTEDRAKEVLAYAAEHGDVEAMETFSVKEDTLRRYRAEYPDSALEVTALLLKIQERYTDKELQAIAKGGQLNKQKYGPSVIKRAGETHKFGVMGDTHIGGEAFKPEYLLEAFNTFEAEGIDTILHVGDVTEGMSNRAGHVYELTHIGYAEQKAYAIELLSQWPGKWYMIDGNHDRWYIKSNGAKIVEDICAALPDAEFLGHDEGDLWINNAWVKLWHGEDGSCFDDQTDIQTRNGWKRFSELTPADEVATMTKDGHEFQWQKPIDIYRGRYRGNMIHFRARMVDCMVTPNHGMWTRASQAATYKRLDNCEHAEKSHRRLNTEWHRKDAQDVANAYGRQKWQMTKVCNFWAGQSPDYVKVPQRESKNSGVKVHHYGKLAVEDAAELIAWYVTEGHVRKSDITISQYRDVNPLNYAMIVDLAERIGGKSSTRSKYIRIGSMELAEWIVAQCGSGSRDKYLPDWLKNCSADVLEIVMDVMVRGDGWFGPRGGRRGYRSISRRLLDDFAEVAIKCGYSISYGPNGDTVSITKEQVFPTINQRPETVWYDGIVYCCEVPNGLIHVRRNGKTLWTHNSYATSYRIQKLVEAFTGGEKPHILLTGHVHKQGYFFERNVHSILTGAVTTQSKWMRSTRKANHTGYWIIEFTENKSGVSRFRPEFFPFYA